MKLRTIAAGAALLLSCAAASGDTRPDSHAPIGVMGDHTHREGEIMFSYRYTHMNMEGSRDGSSNVAITDIVTNATNRFATLPKQPPTLRISPTKMTMDMHMFGAMYAPTDRITFMGMVKYIDMEMEHTTFMGPTGTNQLGRFTTKTSGIGDTTIAALIKINETDRHRWHLTTGLSLPTGDIEQSGIVLTPMNTRPAPRLPYPMQLGSGTIDPIVGLTFGATSKRWGWGGQWASYLLGAAVSLSGRVDYFDRGNIDGIDAAIVAPVQTADPDRQRVRRIAAGLGVNWLSPDDRHRLALEINAPVSQNLDGPQLEKDWILTIGWQYVA